jgi:hypothetical protein
MVPSQLQDALNNEITLRNWICANLPIASSFVAFDLLLILGLQHHSGQPLQTVKQLFGSLPNYSYIGIRTHYLRFLELNLIELTIEANDKRVKYVKPTQILLDLLTKYLEQKILILNSCKPLTKINR